MPLLVGFVDPAQDAPGFLFPLFRRDPGSNVDLAQVVDHQDVVQGFTEIAAPGALLRQSRDRLSVEVGEPALWAFKDHRNEIHVAAAKDMAAVAAKLLSSANLFEWPLVRLELGSFRDGPRPNVELLQAAFKSVQDDSGELAAAVWRDTEVFTPAVRRDLNRHFQVAHAEQMVVLYRDELNIFIAPALVERLKKVHWEETWFVLKAFSLPKARIAVRPLGRAYASQKRKAARWKIIGIGGVARHVLQDEFFHGRVFNIRNAPAGPAIRAGGTLSPSLDQAGPMSQFIAVCQSAEGQVEAMARKVEGHPPEVFIRHLVNVRPFSFGSPPPRKTPVDQLPTLARGFDHAWIIAGHRQRRTGNFRNQFSVSNAASRHVKVLLKSLIRRGDLVSRLTNEGLSQIPSLNLFGMLRPRAEWSEQEVLRYLLGTMLCEEALLHTSEHIIVLMPGELRSRMVQVRLGRHKYIVNLLADARSNRSADLMCWAVSASLPKDFDEAFKDFCISLLDGYRWDYRGEDGESLIFEDEGEVLNVWPAQTLSAVMGVVSKESQHGREWDVILTPQSIPAHVLGRARKMGWSLMHYSELPRWLRTHYRSSRFAEMEGR
ncbi:MAG: hypothetical protein PS018_03530 [bacterium]|nr:hypothetical protein [bacterium]